MSYQFDDERKREFWDIQNTVLVELGKKALDDLDHEAYLAIVTPWWNDAYNAAKKHVIEILEKELKRAEGDERAYEIIDYIKYLMEKSI